MNFTVAHRATRCPYDLIFGFATPFWFLPRTFSYFNAQKPIRKDNNERQPKKHLSV